MYSGGATLRGNTDVKRNIVILIYQLVKILNIYVRDLAF